mgnify:CR=1 FL=1
MKIDPNVLIGTITGKAAGAKQTAVTGNVFEDILKGVQNTGAPGIQNVHAPFAVESLNPQKIKALSLSEQAVDMLDSYAKSLSDPAQTLKQIAPVVDELEAMRSSILEARSFLADSDRLKGVMDDVASAINTEVLKFRRGDLIG